LVQLLTSFINNDIIPFIPEHGSVGASGDLVQLAHMALTLIGEGNVFYKGKLQTSAEVMAALNIKPFSVYVREVYL
jgi:histidine ammonia-lyase